MAALDAGARIDVRAFLRAHLREFPGPVLLVTHDPLEAMVLADRLVVLEGGRVVQEGPPHEVARRPASSYVARLVGLNLWAGVLRGGEVALDGGGTLAVSEGATVEEGDPVLAGSARSRRWRGSPTGCASRCGARRPPWWTSPTLR
jgi:molybdate transport system ATP-binding protein